MRATQTITKYRIEKATKKRTTNKQNIEAWIKDRGIFMCRTLVPAHRLKNAKRVCFALWIKERGINV